MGVSSLVILGVAGLVLAAGAGWVLSRARPVWFFGIVHLLGVSMLPAAALVALGSASHALLGLIVVLVPPLAAGFRRVPVERWRIARRLGGSRALTLRAVVLPAVLPLALVACVETGLLLALKARLERMPPGSIELQDPQTDIG